MLELLKIKNLALIEDMALEFHPGLNVLTGESGAGKSFILKALDFIMGEKIRASMVRPDKDKARVEALFHLNGRDLIIRRELSAETGRSRFYLNDSLSSQEKIQSLRDSLLIHTSQHGQQKLLKPAFHHQILDSFLPDLGLIKSRDEFLAHLSKILAEKKELRSRLNSLAEKREYLEFQRSQIEAVHPEPGEEEDLLEKRQQIKTRAELAGSIQRALDILHGPEGNLLNLFYELKKNLTYLAENQEKFYSAASEMEDFQVWLEDTDRLLRTTSTRADSAELESIESRLWELAQLRRKLNRSMDQIFELQEEINQTISFLDQGDLSFKQLDKEEKRLKAELKDVISRLDKLRREQAGLLKAELEKELRCLGFSEHVTVVFEFSPCEIYPEVFEPRLRLLWVPNPGQPPQPLDKIASGGELSRFLLALVGLKSEKNLPALIFDEVDAGIGGTTLNQVGQRISQLARDRQVILITHWAQLASLARKHFLVQKKIIKDQTFTLCTSLDGEQSKKELARMVGGDKGLELAAELRNEAGQ